MPKRSQKSGEETDRRPRGRPLCRTGPSSEPQETDNQESPRSLQTQHKKRCELKKSGWKEKILGRVLLGLTKPGLLVPLHLDGETKVGQFHRRPFGLGGQ